MSFQIHDPHDPFKEHFNTRPNVARLTSIKQWDNFSHGINVLSVLRSNHTSVGVSEYSFTRSTDTMFVSRSLLIRTIQLSVWVTLQQENALLLSLLRLFFKEILFSSRISIEFLVLDLESCS